MVTRKAAASVIALSVFTTFLPTSQVLAQSAPTAAAAPTANPSADASSSISVSAPAPAPTADATPAVTPASTDAAATATTTKKTEQNLSKLEDKINDSIKDVTRRLSSSTADLTLEDLNSARIAIARIDAMTDIEKHLGDLERARKDRREISSSSRDEVPQIPQTVFQAPGFNPGAQNVVATAAIPFGGPPFAEETQSRPISNVVINRIMGSEGHYSANISVSGSPSKTLRVGDKIAGGKISNITAKTVEIEQDGTLHEYQIKGVDKVFGRSL